MNDKDIVSRLKGLKSINPDSDWLNTNRSVLVNQIYSGRDKRDTLSFWAKFNLTMHQLSQPYVVAASILLFFASSGLASVYMSKDSTPGEPLYGAKKLSEKAQWSVAFKEKDKTELNLSFASNRVEEAANVVKTESVGSETKQEKVAVLANDFKKEVGQVKDRLIKSGVAVKAQPAKQAVSVHKPAVRQVAVAAGKKPSSTPAKKDDFFTAGSSKDGRKLDINLQDSTDKKIEAIKSQDNPIDVLNAAEQLFESQDYDAAKEAIKKADELIQNK